ncbi:asparagine synthase-related protein [Magnetococcales bacterium HHB-1]
MDILIDKALHWRQKKENGLTIHSIGDEAPVDHIVAFFIEHSHLLDDDMAPLALNQSFKACVGFFSVIIASDNHVLAVVDSCGSTPIFYHDAFESLAISNQASLLKKRFNLSLHESGKTELLLAGYVTGEETLYKNLKQLQPGSWLLCNKKQRLYSSGFYFQYLPSTFFSGTLKEQDPENLKKTFNTIMDRVTDRLIKKASGAPIWLSLSGGLDSRLLLAKLVEHQYPALYSYTFGPPNNREALRAEAVAKLLNVPLHKVYQPAKLARSYFWSEERKKYWQTHDGLSRLPTVQGLQPIRMLQEQGVISKDALIINGQSGDYVTGKHIPEHFFDPEIEAGYVSLARLCDTIIEKHFSLWRNYLTPENRQIIMDRLQEQLSFLIQGQEQFSPETAAQIYEYWEWIERQCKYVVRSKSMYEFCGHSWHMPLWDLELVRFWREVPIPLRRRQSLYADYLMEYDFQGVFSRISTHIWRWPGWTLAAVPAAFLVGKIFGAQKKERFYQQARYFGHYANLYRAYPYDYFKARASHLRNPIALQVLTLFEEHDIALPPEFDF